MVMQSGATLGYEGKHSEPHNPTKKFQVFPVFDHQESDMIVEGIKQNLSPTNELLTQYHGAKKEPGEMSAWLLDRNTPELKWIYGRINPAVKSANVSWGFELAHLENIHLLEFGVTNNTEWHLDGFDLKTQRRKMAFSVMLSGPGDYRGGDIELWHGAERESIPQPQKGEMAVWPAFMLNRIASVKRGPRYALVGWAVGKEPFK